MCTDRRLVAATTADRVNVMVTGNWRIASQEAGNDEGKIPDALDACGRSLDQIRHRVSGACLGRILKMELGLRGKRALVTGASKGIGLAIARSLAEEGCHLHIAGRSAEALDEAKRSLSATGVEVRTHSVDLSKVADQERLRQACPEIDILVNNAGSNPGGGLEDTSDPVWRDSWDLKVFGYINLCRSYYLLMKDRGTGVILNIIGYAGERLNARYIIGTTSNAALMAFTRSVGSTSPDFGVRVVGINPGYTSTDRAQSVLRTISEKQLGAADRWREVERGLNLPFARMAEPAEIANVAAFLVSARASYVSGTVITVDGGATNRNF
jgi:3-oxoacyl-[acyl-carrier protein] reductase